MDGTLRNMTSLYITRDGKMLMLYRIGSRVVSPSWCGIGGHFEKAELNDAKSAILRELKEEIGLSENDVTDISLKYVTLRHINHELRLNYYFFARLCDHAVVQNDCGEGRLEWVDLNVVLDKEMPFTAKHVLRHYFALGRQSDLAYCGVARKSGVTFTELEAF